MILGADGFDLHPNGNSPDSLEGVFSRSIAGSSNLQVKSTAGRGGGGALYFAVGEYVDITIPANAEVWLSMAVDSLENPHGIVQFRNGSGAILSVLCNSSGQIEIRKGTQTGTLIATSATTYGATWKALAIKVKFDGATGTVQMRTAGAATLDVDLAGQDTAGVAGDCTVIRVGRYYAAQDSHQIDDLVWGDVSGTYNNDLPAGDLRVTKALPDEDTADADFTPSAGSDNYAMVDDATHDGDATYVESSTSGHKDRYTFTPGLSAVNIKAVIPWTVAKGGGSLRHVLTGSAGTEEDNGADIATDATSYQSQESVWEVDPDTSLPWTAAGLDDADFSAGQKVA